jgi:hypothetical protein
MPDATPNPLDAERAELRRQGEELRQLREELMHLRATREDTPLDSDLDRSRRSTTVNSAFGGTVFKPSGVAALPAFKPFTGVDGANPKYDRKEKARAGDPGKFSGDMTLFDNWVYKLADKLEEVEPIFRTEKSRMRFLMNMVEGEAMMSIETRYRSTTRPFSCLAEMIQVLSAAYHDPNQASAARKALRKHYYTLGKSGDIHAFISQFNALAMKAEIPESQWKVNLWDRIPPHIDGRLLHDSEDDNVGYEAFCNFVAKAVYSNQRGYEQRWHERHPRDAKPNAGKPKVSSDTVLRGTGNPGETRLHRRK